MARVVLFHSMLGLRKVELGAAERLRAAGHQVITPDLYVGETAGTLDEGFALKERIGWPAIEQRARHAVRDLPDDTVLAGVSMGAGVVNELLAHRPHAAGVLLLHGLAAIPATARAGLPVQLHVAGTDFLAPPTEVASWLQNAKRSGADAHVFAYQHVGHFYTDSESPDHDEGAAALTWQRAQAFLQNLSA
jgi:dienelactone hydrolase